MTILDVPSCYCYVFCMWTWQTCTWPKSMHGLTLEVICRSCWRYSATLVTNVIKHRKKQNDHLLTILLFFFLLTISVNPNLTRRKIYLWSFRPQNGQVHSHGWKLSLFYRPLMYIIWRCTSIVGCHPIYPTHLLHPVNQICLTLLHSGSNFPGGRGDLLLHIFA